MKAIAGKHSAAESMVLKKFPEPSFPGKALIRKTKGENIVERTKVAYLVIKANRIFKPVPRSEKAKISGMRLVAILPHCFWELVRAETVEQ